MSHIEKKPNKPVRLENGIGIGIDLGTSNLLVFVEGEGIIFNEPSVIAIDKKTRAIIVIGKEAFNLIEKEHDKVEIIRPLQDGVIADIDIIKATLVFATQKVLETRANVVLDRLVICTPSEITGTERSAIQRLGNKLVSPGGKCFLEEEVKAGAIGAGLNIFQPKGCMVVDIGGGTTDIGILSLGEVIISRTSKVAGDYIDKAIQRFVKEKHGLEIGLPTAERIKKELGSVYGPIPALKSGYEKIHIALGKDIVNGLPSERKITASEIRKVVESCFELIKTKIISALEITPPELAGDITDSGVLLTGGGALIPGVIEFMREITNVPVRRAQDTLKCVAEGTKILLNIAVSGVNMFV